MNSSVSHEVSSFDCPKCNNQIDIPSNLPPTSAPCPHCGEVVTSPDFSKEKGDEKKDAPLANLKATPQLEAPPKDKPKETTTKKSLGKLKKIQILLFITLLLGLACVLLVFVKKTLSKITQPLPTETNPTEDYIEGLHSDDDIIAIKLKSTLQRFQQSATLEERAMFTLNSEETFKEMTQRYGAEVPEESDTPAGLFSYYKSSDGKHFELYYKLSKQTRIRDHFVPILGIQEHLGVEQIDPLTSSYIQELSKPTPGKIVAAFFKKTEDGQVRLLWDLYDQTKNERFKKFIKSPQAGKTGRFMLTIEESLSPTFKLKEGWRVYRLISLGDPSNSIDIHLPANGELAQKLSEIHWHQTEGAPRVQMITLDLICKGDKREDITIENLVCWGYKGWKERPFEPAH